MHADADPFCILFCLSLQQLAKEAEEAAIEAAIFGEDDESGSVQKGKKVHATQVKRNAGGGGGKGGKGKGRPH